MEHFVVQNFYRFEVVLHPQLGDVHGGGEDLELELVNVGGRLRVSGPVSVAVVSAVGILVIKVILLLHLWVVVLVKRGPARLGQRNTQLPGLADRFLADDVT